ncbi:hypothetical protein [Streptomyces sp. NPDC049906]|uniref:hypothetical protein n=1 Tax=Streptomyces sp. NPDC049906 TaxID=3155656 RepID=UPI00342FE00A
MEQPIGKNPSLVDAAAIDPAHVPGIATPVAVSKPGAARPDGGDRDGNDPPARSETAAEPEAAVPSEPEESEVEESEVEESGTATGSAVPEGPAFEAADRRGSMAVDGTGVRFTLDDQAAEWTWDEIGAVEVTTGRFPRRLTLYVHTPDRRWYPNEVHARSKGELARWVEELDAALDAWFDEGGEGTDGARTEGAGASAGTTAEPTAEKSGAGKED